MAKIVKEINPNIPVVIVDCEDHSGVDYFSTTHYEEEGFFKLENVIAVIKFQRFDSTHLPDGLDHNVHLPSLTDPRVIGVCYPSIVLDNYEKREELDDSWENKEYDIIKFRNGYAKDAPTMLVEYVGLNVGNPFAYEIQLGKIIEVIYE